MSEYLVDRVVESIRSQMVFPWVNNSYGRAFRLVKTHSGRDTYYPAAYDRNGEYVSLLPDEMKGNTMFFMVEQPHRFINWQPGIHNRMRCGFSIIFWYDIRTVYGKTSFDTERVRFDVLKALRNVKILRASLRITETTETDVYKEYTLSETALQHMMFPFYGLRVNGELTYTEDCD